MGLGKKVFGAAFCVALAVIASNLNDGYEYYKKVRQDTLGIEILGQQGKSRFLGVMLLQMQEGRKFEPSALEAVCDSVNEGGSKLVYTGRAIQVAVESKQPGLEEIKQGAVEAVLLIEFGADRETSVDDATGKDLIHKWRSSAKVQESGMRVMAAQGFRRSDRTNFAVPLVLTALQGVIRLFGLDKSYHLHDLVPMTSETSKIDNAGTQEGFSDKKMSNFIKNFDKLSKSRNASADDAIFIWNWLQKGTASQQKADGIYGAQMMAMLSTHGGGIMEFGTAVSVDGNFDNIAAVYYPGVGFFNRLLSSKWMRHTVQGKKPGDSIAVITTPFKTSSKKRLDPAKSWVAYESMPASAP